MNAVAAALIRWAASARFRLIWWASSVPPVIDETYEAPLPERCPQCGGAGEFSHLDRQYQVEIPRRPIYRQFNVAVGRCPCCTKRVQGRHPLQTSNALGCCASQASWDWNVAVVTVVGPAESGSNR